MRIRSCICLLLTAAFAIAAAGCSAEPDRGASGAGGENTVPIVDVDEPRTGGDKIVVEEFASFDDMKNFYSEMSTLYEMKHCLPLLDNNEYNVDYLFYGVCGVQAYDEIGFFNTEYIFFYFGGVIYNVDEFGVKQDYCFFRTMAEADSFDNQINKVSYKPPANRNDVFNYYIDENPDPFLQVRLERDIVGNSEAAELLDRIANSLITL